MRCLILQGPVGPLFSTLQAELDRRGWSTLRLALDAGDKLFVNGTNKTWHGNRPWKPWLRKNIQEFNPDVIILFGAERPAHIAARHLAKQRNIPVLCIEEGYLRPGFLTAEWGGNNYASPLRQAPLVKGTMPQAARVKPGMRWMVGWSALYYTARALFSLPGQRRLHHRQYFWPAEVARWGMNLTRRYLTMAHDRRLLYKLVNKSYDVVALQVPGDASLTSGGDGWTTERLVQESIASLANYAPKNHHLVFKLHPLARGHTRIDEEIRSQAAAQSIQSRVHILYGGPLAPILKYARGLMTISSTSALSAVEKGKTTLVLGKGIVRRKELTLCGPSSKMIHKFWTAKPHATQDNIEAFWQTMGTMALIPGDAYQKTGREVAAKAIADKCQHVVETDDQILEKRHEMPILVLDRNHKDLTFPHKDLAF